MPFGEKPFYRIAWWNTSLAPLAKYRGSDAQRDLATGIVKSLLFDLGVDCLALGEINNDILQHLVLSTGAGEYASLNCSGVTDGVHFDVGIIFRKSRLQVSAQTAITSEYAAGKLKVAQRLDLDLKEGQRLYLFLVHWPSRLHLSEYEPKRGELGTSLKLAARGISARDAFNVIFLGDFNDDPFSPSLAGHLLATRDRGLVRRSKTHYYNPFWRHLGESAPHVPRMRCESICGTYLQRSGSETSRWRTFDQIIFSPAFLIGGVWNLDEERTQVIRIPELEAIVKDRKTIFDHLPILGTIRM